MARNACRSSVQPCLRRLSWLLHLLFPSSWIRGRIGHWAVMLLARKREAVLRSCDEVWQRILKVS
jgi:hypothetical protein